MMGNMVASMTFRSAYRPYPCGSATAPVHARSAGRYRVVAGWRDARMRKNFAELYWAISGAVKFRHDRQEWVLKPGEASFLLPGDLHDIEAVAEVSEYCWLTFDGPHLSFLLDAFGIARPPRPAGVCPEELFWQLEGELRDLKCDGEYRAGATLYRILALAVGGPANAMEGALEEEFEALAEENFRDSACGVAELAAQLGVHRTTLNRLVCRRFGVPPGEYLSALRIREALRLLRDTTYSVKEIAEAAGFSNQNYFAKVLLRRFGKTPSQFRRHG